MKTKLTALLITFGIILLTVGISFLGGLFPIPMLCIVTLIMFYSIYQLVLLRITNKDKIKEKE
jgi:hypothetical protein